MAVRHLFAASTIFAVMGMVTSGCRSMSHTSDTESANGSSGDLVATGVLFVPNAQPKDCDIGREYRIYTQRAESETKYHIEARNHKRSATAVCVGQRDPRFVDYMVSVENDGQGKITYTGESRGHSLSLTNNGLGSGFAQATEDGTTRYSDTANAPAYVAGSISANVYPASLVTAEPCQRGMQVNLNVNNVMNQTSIAVQQILRPVCPGLAFSGRIYTFGTVAQTNDGGNSIAYEGTSTDGDTIRVVVVKNGTQGGANKLFSVILNGQLFNPEH